MFKCKVLENSAWIRIYTARFMVVCPASVNSYVEAEYRGSFSVYLSVTALAVQAVEFKCMWQIKSKDVCSADQCRNNVLHFNNLYIGDFAGFFCSSNWCASAQRY